MSEDLRDVINAALGQLEDPIEDTPEAEAPTTIEDDIEVEDTEPTEDTEAEAEESDEDEDGEDDEETEDEVDDDGETYQVKIDGETVEVTLKEALAGYQRQADYTRKAQALAAEREAFQTEIQEYSEVIDQVQSLDQAWEQDPVGVLAHFTSNTENPTQAVALLIKELAAANLLERQFLDMFGITPDVQQSWSQETELEKLRRQQASSQTAQQARTQELEMEAQVQEAIAEYERQIDDILDEEGLDLTVKERKEFRAQVAGYARSNDITNLKAAYKAMRFEESKAKQKLAAKSAERAKAKKATGVVARGGSPAGGAPVAGEQDLRSIITAAMRESSPDIA
jgi:hypothetical protein